MASLLDERDASEVLSQFPAVEFAVAYGSGAIAQGGYDYSTQSSSSSSSSSDSLPMIDFIFAVRDSEEFHLQNLARNAEHYSPLIPFTGAPLDAPPTLVLILTPIPIIMSIMILISYRILACYANNSPGIGHSILCKAHKLRERLQIIRGGLLVQPDGHYTPVEAPRRAFDKVRGGEIRPAA